LHHCALPTLFSINNYILLLLESLSVSLADDTLKLAKDLCASVTIQTDTPFDKIKTIVNGNLDFKIPIPAIIYNKLHVNKTYAQDFIESNFRILEFNEDTNQLWPIIATIINPLYEIDQTAEFNNISIFDSHIRSALQLIKLIFPYSCSLKRNISATPNMQENLNSRTSSARIICPSVHIQGDNLAQRPDFSMFIDKFLVFVGEEEPNADQRNDAYTQLKKLFGPTKKISSLMIGNNPFLFGYVTYGSQVELFCFDRCTNIHNLASFDINNRSSDGLRLFISIINVARCLAAYRINFKRTELSDIDFFTQIKRHRGASVTCFPFGVLKRYKPHVRNFSYEEAGNMYEIYTHMMNNKNEYSNAIQCVQISKPKECSSGSGSISENFDLSFSPLCVPVTSERLSNVTEIIKALRSVLNVLVNLHKYGYVHGDVRWPNIMYDVDENKYLVIDFDNGGKYPLHITHPRQRLKGYPLKDMQGK
jgi:hypothetical protein